MKEYVIGFYNPIIEGADELSECNVVFNDLEKLEEHLRKGDTIMLVSGLSLYGIPTKKILELVATFELKILFKDSKIDTESANKFLFNTMVATNEYISNNKEMIKKLVCR